MGLTKDMRRNPTIAHEHHGPQKTKKSHRKRKQSKFCLSRSIDTNDLVVDQGHQLLYSTKSARQPSNSKPREIKTSTINTERKRQRMGRQSPPPSCMYHVLRALCHPCNESRIFSHNATGIERGRNNAKRIPSQMHAICSRLHHKSVPFNPTPKPERRDQS